MKKSLKVIRVIFLILIIVAIVLSCCNCEISNDHFLYRFLNSSQELVSPWLDSPVNHLTDLPLLKYTIINLKNYSYNTSEIVLSKYIDDDEDISSFIFEYQTMNKKMTGSTLIPKKCFQKACPVIIMVRGYATSDQYFSGFGTQKAAKLFALNGYVTLAPDFFGFAEADPEPENSWEARFVKPVNIIELIKSIQNNPQLILNDQKSDFVDSSSEYFNNQAHQSKITLDSERVGFWAHSNGGQIALSVLQILEESHPTTLWAPVTAPFPYSILFFTRTSVDEGRETRAWLAQFEKDYDPREFSITQHLQYLQGPLQIHHGERDTDALKIWSDSFVSLITEENTKRTRVSNLEAQGYNDESDNLSKKENEKLHQPILINYYTYPNADHNLQPTENWLQAINRDLAFFDSYFSSNIY